MEKVKRETSWHELLGKDDSEFSDEKRRERWERWKDLAVKNGDRDIVDYWTDSSHCGDCIHKKDDWCKLMELPVTINPILTMKHGMLGFACMGGGKEEPGQKEIDFEVADEDLPF